MSTHTRDDHATSMDSPARERQPTGDSSLDRWVEDLPEEIAPANDLWPGIESRLAERSPRRSRSSAFGTLAGLAMAAGLAGALLGLGWVFRSPVEGTDPSTMAAGDATEAGSYAVPGVGALDRSLLAALERRRLQLGPDTAGSVEADIARLGGAVGDLLRALASKPDDPVLHRHLAARQHQQAELLTRLSQL